MAMDTKDGSLRSLAKEQFENLQKMDEAEAYRALKKNLPADERCVSMDMSKILAHVELLLRAQGISEILIKKKGGFVDSIKTKQIGQNNFEKSNASFGR